MKFSKLKYERLIYVFILSIIFFTIAIFVIPQKENLKNIYNKFWVNKTYAGSNYNMIIIGDSRVYRGISPNEIEVVLPNYKVLNFGFSSGRLDGELLKQAENKLNNSDNRVIVLGITPNSLTEHPMANAQIIEYLKMPREERYEILYFKNILSLFEPITKETFKNWNNKELTERNYVEEYTSKGWVASSYIVEDTITALNSYRKWFSETNISENITKRLFSKINDWQRKGIKVYAFRMPTSWSMYNIEDTILKFDEKKIAKRCIDAGAVWVDVNKKSYHSYDGSHLEKKSAIEFSKDLACKLKLLVDKIE